MINNVRRAALASVLAAGLAVLAGPSALPASSAHPAVRVALVDGRLEITGSPGPDALVVRSGPTGGDTLEVLTNPSSAPAVQVHRAGVTKGIEVALGTGDDTFTVVESGGIFTSSIPMTVAGGAEPITWSADRGGETLRGGPGPDLVDGRGGPDQIVLGDADDSVVWTTDDGDDIVDGGPGSDRVVVRGAATGDLLEVSGLDGGLSVSPGSSTAAEFWDVESLAVEPLTGSDKVVLGDLTGTGLTDVVADFAPTIPGEGPDRIPDALEVHPGRSGVNLSGHAGAVDLTGLSASIHIRNADPRFPHDDSDLLTLDTPARDDVVTAFGLSFDAIRFVVEAVRTQSRTSR